MRVKDFIKWSAISLMAAFAFTSCSSDDDSETKKAENAQMLTFGFYAADNAGILSKDYVATVPELSTTATTYGIDISMPSIVDKSSLVARFTTTAGNIVKVNGKAQVSQTNKNDFTAPVDYMVSNSDSTQNLRYTVTVSKSSNMAWTEGATYTGPTVYSGAVMKVNPESNVPYIAFKVRKDSVGSTTDKMSVLSLDGTSWKQVGTAGFSGAVASSYYNFDFDAAGTPYVAFSDNSVTASDTKLAGGLSVMKFDGSTWNYVGDQGLIMAQSTYVGLAALGANNIIASQINNSAKGAFTRRAMVLSSWNGAWTNAESSLLPAGQAMYTCTLADNNKTAYLFSLNRTGFGMNIFKYENGAWTALRTSYVRPNATQTSIAGYGQTIAPDGTLYVWTGDDADVKGTYNIRLESFNATTNTWTTVSGNTLPLGFTYDSHLSISVAVAPDGTLFVAYNNKSDQNYPYVIYLDQEAKQWSTPTRIAAVAATDVNLAFSSTGIGYITFTDADNHIRSFIYAEK